LLHKYRNRFCISKIFLVKNTQNKESGCYRILI
jgi:hypothetical protein